jgi:hypothetical protein
MIMPQREIVIEALEHRETRSIPYTISFTSQAVNNMKQAGKFEEFKNRFGSYITSCFYQNRSTQCCLPHLSPSEVQAEIVKVIKAAGKNGGRIIPPTHDVPVENILAMAEVFQHQNTFLQAFFG